MKTELEIGLLQREFMAMFNYIRHASVQHALVPLDMSLSGLILPKGEIGRVG